jgi:hypothetical protein
MPQILACNDLRRRPPLRVVVPGPTLLESIQKKGGAPFVEAVRAGTLPSVKRIIEVVGAGGIADIRLGIPCWTSTIVAYAPPGQPLGEIIRNLKGRIRWSLEVPAEYRDARDVALIAEQPDYTIFCKDDGWAVQSARFTIHPLPDRPNWFRFEQGMPCSSAVHEDSPEAIWLSRGDSYVGPVTIGLADRVTRSQPAEPDRTGLAKREPGSIVHTVYLSINMRGESQGLGVIIENEMDSPETRTARAPE